MITIPFSLYGVAVYLNTFARSSHRYLCASRALIHTRSIFFFSFALCILNIWLFASKEEKEQESTVKKKKKYVHKSWCNHTHTHTHKHKHAKKTYIRKQKSLELYLLFQIIRIQTCMLSFVLFLGNRGRRERTTLPFPIHFFMCEIIGESFLDFSFSGKVTCLVYFTNGSWMVWCGGFMTMWVCWFIR